MHTKAVILLENYSLGLNEFFILRVNVFTSLIIIIIGKVKDNISKEDGIQWSMPHPLDDSTKSHLIVVTLL